MTRLGDAEVSAAEIKVLAKKSADARQRFELTLFLWRLMQDSAFSVFYNACNKIENDMMSKQQELDNRRHKEYINRRLGAK
jgi:hypothetical protein